MEEAQFTLVSILPLDYTFPADLNITIKEKEIQWQYSFKLWFNPFPGNRTSVSTDMSYKLYNKNDLKKKTIAMVETHNIFSVSDGLSQAAKLQVLFTLLPIAVCNLQGIYAAKTEGSKLNKILPPPLNFFSMKEQLEKRIAHDWK